LSVHGLQSVTAVILCGGEGRRLMPLTGTLPKPLVSVNGRPLLAFLMEHLAAAGIRRFLLCVGHRSECFAQFVREHAHPSWAVDCVDSGQASMTGRILHARERVPGTMLVCYGDTIANLDLAALWQGHRESALPATLTVHPLRSPFGIVDLGPENLVLRFREKPLLPYWINIGFLLLEPAALDLIPPGSDMPEFLTILSRAGLLRAHLHHGKHITINTEKDHQQAQSEICDFLTAASDPSL
jgi:NDP-sugar pyrophosphorylase family protein